MIEIIEDGDYIVDNEVPGKYSKEQHTKEVRLFGILLYRRTWNGKYTKGDKTTIGFTK